MTRWVHANEVAEWRAWGQVGDRDATMLGGGRERGVVELHGHDVIVAGRGPVGSIGALTAIVDRCLAAQSCEQLTPGVVRIELGIADIDLAERDCRGIDVASVLRHGHPPPSARILFQCLQNFVYPRKGPALCSLYPTSPGPRTRRP